MRSLFLAALIGLCTLLAGQAAFAADSHSDAEKANLAATQKFIDAFTSGDSDTLFSMMSDDIVWYGNGDGQFVPSHGTWHGKDEVKQWLTDVTNAWDFLEFAADNMYVDGNTVFVLAHEHDRAKATGKEIKENEIMIFTIDGGKIVDFKGFDDSASEHWALTPDAK